MNTGVKKFFGVLLAAAVGIAGGALLSGCGDNSAGSDDGGGSACGKDETANSCKKTEIGGKMWFAENLNRATDSSWCYDNEESNCDKYGRLYNYSAAVDACPMGWHLPTRDEWDALAEAVGGVKIVQFVPIDSIERHHWENAATILRAKTGWTLCSGCPIGTDSYGFSALPGGTGMVIPTASSFGNIGQGGGWWAAGEYTGKNSSYAWDFRIAAAQPDRLEGASSPKYRALSVRCVMD